MKTKKARALKKAKKTATKAAVRSKAARAHIAEGTRLFALAGRPTKAEFVKRASRTQDDLGTASRSGCGRQALPRCAQGEVLK
jgi:preprotein translocase subunit Sss1